MTFKPNSIDRIAATQPTNLPYVSYDSMTESERNMKTEMNGITVEVSGAEFISSNNDGVELSLEGIEIVDINWTSVNSLLIQSGVSQMDADDLIDQFADITFTHLIAKALAKRIKRI